MYLTDKMRNLVEDVMVAPNGCTGEVGSTAELGGMWLACPITLVDTTVDAFVMEVTTAATTGGTVYNVAIYDIDGSGSHHPGAIIESASIDVTTTGVKIAAFSEPRTLTGKYWLVNQIDGADATVVMRSYQACNASSYYETQTYNTSSPSLLDDGVNVYTTSITSGLPNPFTSSLTYNSTNRTRSIVALRGTRSDL